MPGEEGECLERRASAWRGGGRVPRNKGIGRKAMPLGEEAGGGAGRARTGSLFCDSNIHITSRLRRLGLRLQGQCELVAGAKQSNHRDRNEHNA